MAAEQDEPEVTKIEEPLVISRAIEVKDQGRLGFNTIVHKENPTAELRRNEFHGYNFRAKAGTKVTITASGAGCGAPDTFIHLFKPAVGGDRGVDVARNDDAFAGTCSLDSRISNFDITVDGDWLIVVTTFLQQGGGNYQLTLTCNSGDETVCAQPGQPTFATQRIAQTDIDSGTLNAASLFSTGFFLFKHIHRLEEGLGNSLIGGVAGDNPRPNFRRVHEGGFGAPEAVSCVPCHNQQDLLENSGDIRQNIFQAGDGINPASGLPRNAPQVFGLGYLQAMGEEMTRELQGQRTAALQQAQQSGVAVTTALSSNGVSFGSITANPNGTFVTTGVQGVNADLKVRPLGRKGREDQLRRFIEGGYRVHFGMQTEPQVNANCITPNPGVLGNGPNCQDPDNDGFVKEITDGQLSAISVYLGLRQVPVRVPHADPALQARAVEGEALFASVGCAGCHTPSMVLNDPRHTEKGDTTGGAGITVDLRVDSRTPRPTVNADGTMTVEMWTDLKRHAMGAALADNAVFQGIAPDTFVTPALWAAAVTAPYLHDGRAPTLHDAILQHAGEAQAVRDAYVALGSTNQGKILAFLGTLSRAEKAPVAPQPTVNLSGFRLTQTNTGITVQLGATVAVQKGGYLVIARNATRASFESFWGILFDPDVVFINAAGIFPVVNGGETYTLRNAALTVIDGPTISQPIGGGRNFQRVSGTLPANLATSWVSRPAIKGDGSPGSGHASTGANLIYISEFSDAVNNSAFEFIEIFIE